MKTRCLAVRGASQNNLRHIDVDLPHGSLIAVSGVSGSGKTSLVFDTIYAEARRRFLLALDPSGQGLERRLRPPRVRRLDGLAPAIAIRQERLRHNPRATVGTVSGLHQYLRLLYVRLGTPHCPACGAIVRWHRFEEVYETASGLPAGTRIEVLAPHRLAQDESLADFLRQVERSGYRRIRAGGVPWLLEDVTPEKMPHRNLQVVVDRLVVKPETRRRLKGSLQAALDNGDGQVALLDPETGQTLAFSVRPGCTACGAAFPAVTPSLFSFDSVLGACTQCRGLGVLPGIEFNQVFAGGTSSPVDALAPLWEEFGHRDLERQLQRFCRRNRVDADTAVRHWPGPVAELLWRGVRQQGGFVGVRRWLERLGARAAHTELAWLEEFLSDTPCPDCHGERLCPAAREVLVDGERITRVSGRSITALSEWLAARRFSGPQATIGETLRMQMQQQAAVLQDLGVGYLQLDRRADTLSSGELQRLRLGAALGSGMTQVLYILDEPSVGLHARDAQRLLDALRRLRDAGNTVIMVEHDPHLLRHADWLIDLGPGAGPDGGTLVAAAPPAEVAKGDGATAACLRPGAGFSRQPRLEPGGGGWLHLEGATGHNLKDVSVSLPLASLVCVTGVSGSGKSTLVHETLYPLAAARLQSAEIRPLAYRQCSGLEQVHRVVAVDQSSIGRSPRSNVATYTGLLAAIRRIFAALPEARLRAYTPAHFSFNAAEGACPECRGSGVGAVHRGILADIEVPCASCGGRRYRSDVLDARYRGLDIAAVLELTVSEALEVFEPVPQIARRLKVLVEVGLGYLRLGQPAVDFSGGEAQRVKLATELGRSEREHTLYILDEPTTGLHMQDVGYLLALLQKLVEARNSVIVIEHHLEFIAAADYIIDLGPGGGDDGGIVVAAGTPRQVAATDSITGAALRAHLALEGDG